MKNSKKFFCGIAIFSLAVGAGVFALSQGQSGFRRAEAAVTDVEPISELHLDQTKIKNVSIQYETMAGHNGNEVAAYVASATGLAEGKNAEYRFVTEGTEGGTKVAYSKAVEQVRFWYKLTNSSERNVADGAFPYLLQVLDSKGTYPLRTWNPDVDGQWHEQTMDVGSEFYNQFAGFVVKSGDLNGSITIAGIQLITTSEAAGDLHVVPTKVQRVDYHFEWLTNHAGEKVAAYVFEGDGDLYPNPGVNNYMPEMRFVNAASDASNKVASVPAVQNVHFWYKITNTADVATYHSENGTDPYCVQVVGAPSGYPKYSFNPTVDGQWHQFTLDVDTADQNAFAGIIVQAGDLKGSIVITDIELNKYTASEPVSDLHLDQVKIRRVSVHYETMNGHDGNPVDAYVAEGAGNLYPVDGVNNYMPEMRFMNADSGDSVKIPFATPVTNIHFWYKLDNKADVVTHDSEIDGEGYCLQGVTSDGRYPRYHFNPINDGEWHSWLLNFDSTDQSVLAGFIVQAGDLDGSIVIANLEVNGAYEQLANVISFKLGSFNYELIDNYFVQFSMSADVFNYHDAAYTGHYQDHAAEFIAACGADIMNTFTVNGKTLQYWKTYNDQFLTYPRTEGVSAAPMSGGGQYSPVSVEFFENYFEVKLVLEYFPMTSIEIGFLSSFKSVSGGITYETNNDLVFKSTLLADGDGRHPSITFQQDLSHEISREFHINSVDIWPSGQPKYQHFVIWTDVPRNSSKITQAWPHDNYRYIFDDLLIDGVSLTHYACWARGNSLDFDDSWNVNNDYVTETPVAGNRNYNTAIQPSIVTNQDNYVFFVRIPMKLYEDLDVDWANAFSIREGALWMTPDGPARNSALNTVNKSTSKTEVNITNMTVSQANNGTGRIELHTDVDVASIGYNFSDKAWEDCCLDMFRINYQSIRDYNATCGIEISQEEYNIDCFNAYGVEDGKANVSRLTQPIIVHCETNCIVILIHPKAWEQLKTSIIFVGVSENTRVWSDSYAYFYIPTSFSANTDDFFLNDLIADGLHMSDYDSSLTGEGDGSCATYYPQAKAKYLALTSTAKARFLGENTFASARARMAKWAEINGEAFDVSTGEFSRIATFNPLQAVAGQDYTTLIIVVASIVAMLAVGGAFIFIKRRRG